MKAVIFDLDGTLLYTLPDIAGSMNRVLRRFGLPEHPVEKYCYMVGNGAMKLTERAVGGRLDMRNQVYAAYREEYAAHTCDLTAPYPGIPELLAKLKERGILTAVFSNKDHEDTLSVLEHYFAPGTFSMTLGHKQGLALKPAPDGALLIAKTLGVAASEFLYTGDTGTDMDCGNVAGMTTVGVTWGFRPREELKIHQACHIIDRPEEMLLLL